MKWLTKEQRQFCQYVSQNYNQDIETVRKATMAYLDYIWQKRHLWVVGSIPKRRTKLWNIENINKHILPLCRALLSEPKTTMEPEEVFEKPFIYFFRNIQHKSIRRE